MHRRGRFIVVILSTSLFSSLGFGQSVWVGAGDGSSWNDAANWSPASVPNSGSVDVFLDNSTVTGNYTVVLPTSAVRVNRLRIIPTAGDTITVLLPSGNTSTPGFTVGDSSTSNPYDLVIGTGGMFQNSSGSASGEAISFASTSDSLEILDGGRYVHNTYADNSSLLAQLATVSGTGTGIFEYRLPYSGGTFNTPSVTTTYGSLIISDSIAGAGAYYYFHTANPVTIRGDFTINASADQAPVFQGEGATPFTLHGNFTYNGSGYFIGTGTTINFAGSSEQFIGGASYIDLACSVVVDNASGVQMTSDVNEHGSVSLQNGTLNTGVTTTLKIDNGGSINRTSGYLIWNLTITPASGNDSLFFPVGTPNGYTPFTISFPDGAGLTAPDIIEVIAHDSVFPEVTSGSSCLKRFWKVVTGNIAFDGQERISVSYLPVDFNTGVTENDEESLVVGYWTGAQPWVFPTIIARDTGSNHADGGMISVAASLGANETAYVTLGANENALPVELSSLAVTSQGASAILKWGTVTEQDCAGFGIQRQSSGNAEWQDIGYVEAHGTTAERHQYGFNDAGVVSGTYFYRLKQIDRNGNFTYSKSVQVEIGAAPRALWLGTNYPNPFNPATNIDFSVPSDGRATLKVCNMLGQEVATLYDGEAIAGRLVKATFDASRLSSGVYFSRLEFAGRSLVKGMVLLK